MHIRVSGSSQKVRLLIACLVLAAGTVLWAGDGGEQEAKWYDKLDFGGDLRLRYEGFDWDEEFDEGRRDRFRYRLRAGVKAQIRTDLTIGMQVRSGNPDNPHSDNQSFDGGFSKDTISVAELFVNWKATDSLAIMGGKFSPKKLWHVSDMHWDDDVVVEGVLEGFEWEMEGVLKKLELSLYQFILEESSSSGDAYMIGGQIAPTFGLGADNKVTLGLGYDALTNPDQVVALTLSGRLDTEPEGIVTNLVDPETGVLVGDFDVGNLFAVWKNRSIERWPVKVSLFYYRNFGAESAVGSIVESEDGVLVPIVSDLASEDNDTAFYGRIQIGDYKQPGQTAVRYTRYDSKPDAMFYAWVQSDTKRGSNVDGHRVDVRIGMPSQDYLNVTWYNTDWKVGGGATMNRWQVDYIFKF
jgi:hypothetical protein